MTRKKKAAEKPKVKTRDMKPKKDPKGGSLLVGRASRRSTPLDAATVGTLIKS